MKYVGLHSQIWKNNIKSVILLILFPAVIFVLVWIFFYFIQEQPEQRLYFTTRDFLRFIPWL